MPTVNVHVGVFFILNNLAFETPSSQNFQKTLMVVYSVDISWNYTSCFKLTIPLFTCIVHELSLIFQTQVYNGSVSVLKLICLLMQILSL